MLRKPQGSLRHFFLSERLVDLLQAQWRKHNSRFAHDRTRFHELAEMVGGEAALDGHAGIIESLVEHFTIGGQ